jgi:low molecular weight protein-tyrosine phosphatase
MIRLCFVCLGNICRSPTAEGVMRHLVEAAGLTAEIEVDSAGTAGYHAGEPPDHRSAEAAARRGIRLVGKARRFEPEDWDEFDYVLAVDDSTRDNLRRGCPAGAESKLHLLRSFDPDSPPGAGVPDPYYGGDQGFEHVLDMCEAACRGILRDIQKRSHRH